MLLMRLMILILRICLINGLLFRVILILRLLLVIIDVRKLEMIGLLFLLEFLMSELLLLLLILCLYRLYWLENRK